jgi:hypothetical protein
MTRGDQPGWDARLFAARHARLSFHGGGGHHCYRSFVSDITRALRAMENGNSQAAEQLLALVYDELRRLAAAKMARERPGHALHPALVHEAWLRSGGDAQPAWQNRRPGSELCSNHGVELSAIRPR